VTATAEQTRAIPAAQRFAAGRFDGASQVATLAVAVGLGYRLYLTLNIVPPTNSDESTMGLAALHIAEGRDFPVFFYGQNSMSTVEAYLAAPLFVLFGPSIVALRLPMLAVYPMFCYVMYRLTARLYSRWFAVFVVALLAIGSHPVVRGEVFAGGGYPEIKPVGVGLLLLSVWLGSDRDRRARRLLGFATWGLLAGLALWFDWLILPYVVAAGAVLAFGCGRELIGRAGVLLVVGAVVGALPSIIHHLQGGYAESTLAEMLYLSRSGHASVGARLYGGVLFGVPLGTGLCEGAQCRGWPLALGAAYPLLLVLAGALALRGLRAAIRQGPAAGEDRTRQAGRLALVAGAALTLVAYTRSDQAGETPAESVRYLTPLIISVPAVLWPLWSALIRSPRQTLRAGAGALLAIYTFAMASATMVFVADIPASRAAARDERALVAALDERGLTRIYSEYWSCNRITFATRERIVCAALSNDLRPGVDRYLPYRDLVASAPDRVYVLPMGSPVERALAERLRADGRAADVDEVAGYRIYRW
jgi:hypothetical protein